MRVALILLAAVGVQDDGWESLSNREAWGTGKGEPPAAGWAFEDGGVIHRAAKAGDLHTRKKYRDFELEFEWKIAPGANSGVKYRLRGIGPEYQLIDDAKHADSRNNPQRATASLYDVKAPAADKPLKPAGEWNASRIVAKGSHLEHWLNGAKVLEIDIDGEEWNALYAKSKFVKTKGAEQWFGREAGPIMLQDHGDEVWFRALRIRELK
ncbi:MAG TPA: DUF1080 domain-containing protein [Planctomycetota bacterium]|nr:DUF1080 domain-containing protein [Planctomycetota bacterium]